MSFVCTDGINSASNSKSTKTANGPPRNYGIYKDGAALGLGKSLDSQTMKSSPVATNSAQGAGRGGKGRKGERIELPSLPEYTVSRPLRVPGHRGGGPRKARSLWERKETSWCGHYGKGASALPPPHTTGICGESSSWRRVVVVGEWGGQSTATPARFPTRGPEGCQTS